MYNRPEEPSFAHAGLLMSLGLQGHLRVLAATDVYRYLSQVGNQWYGLISSGLNLFVDTCFSSRSMKPLLLACCSGWLQLIGERWILQSQRLFSKLLYYLVYALKNCHLLVYGIKLIGCSIHM